MWKSSLLKFASWFLSIILIIGLYRVFKLYVALDVGAFRVMPTEMQSPLMLWRLIPPAILLLILAHTPPGRTKIGRFLIGIYAVTIIYLHALYFTWSIVGPNIYYPTLAMDLDWIAGPGYVAQATHLFIVIPAFLLMGIFGFVVFYVYKEPQFMAHLFQGSIDLPGFSIHGSNSKRQESTDVLICANKASRKSVLWKEGDQPMNLGIIGPVGSGKTARILIPLLAQFILNLRTGLFVIEPKGDLVERLAKLASMTGRRVVFVDPANPESPVFNPLHGDDIDKIAEINAMTIRATFGQQEAYFANMQEQALKQMIKLLKYIFHNDCTYRDLYNYLLNEKQVVKAMVQLNTIIPVSDDLDDPRVELRDWLNIEYLGKDKMRDAVNGLRGHLQNMIGNRYFRRVTCGKSEVDMESGIRNGDIFLFSTADGVLGESLSQTFGALILQHYQATLLTRGIIPPTGPERNDYKLSILCADEFGGYVNEEFGSFISKSRGYGGVNILAMQTINQLKEVGRGNNVAFQQKVLGQLRSMIIFGGLGIVQADADYFSKNFGTEDQEIVTKRTGLTRGHMSFFFPDSIQEGEGVSTKEMAIHRSTDIRYMSKGVVMYQIMKDQSLQKADLGLVTFFDKKESHMRGAYWFMSKEFEKKAKALRKRLGVTVDSNENRGEPIGVRTRVISALTKAGLVRNKTIERPTTDELLHASSEEHDDIINSLEESVIMPPRLIREELPLPRKTMTSNDGSIKEDTLDRDGDLFALPRKNDVKQAYEIDDDRDPFFG